MIEFHLIRSRRKTISIEVSRDGKVTVRAPLAMPKKYIDQFIQKKRNWIESKLSAVQKRSIPKKRFIEGESFLFLGRPYALQFVNNKIKTEVSGDNIIMNTSSPELVKENLIQFYKIKSKDIIPEIAEEYANIIGVKYNRISINSARKRWGSCSSKGNLNFSWRLILAPEPSVRYVVLHEISHLIELNHSAKFWQIIQSAMPNYKIHDKWLNDYGYLLDL